VIADLGGSTIDFWMDAVFGHGLKRRHFDRNPRARFSFSVRGKRVGREEIFDKLWEKEKVRIHFVSLAFFLNRVIDDFFFPNSQIVECRNGGLGHDERQSEHASKVSN